MSKNIIAQLMAAMATGQSAIIPMELPEGADPQLFFEKLMADMAAKHREECAGCRAEYEAEMAAKALEKHEVDRQARILRDREAFNQATAAKAERFPIGFVMYADKMGVMTPISGSFRLTMKDMEASVREFKQRCDDSGVTELLGLLGKSLHHEIRPVYGE